MSSDNTNPTTSSGAPAPRDGTPREALARFGRARPARVVHAGAAGAFGYFKTTADMSEYTRAHLFGAIGRRTPVLVRFGGVTAEDVAAARTPRGFAVRFRTEQGDYDLVGTNAPVFFLRDPFKRAEMAHTRVQHPDTFWDFFSRSPESTHLMTMLFSDRGIPRSYREMHGFGSHTFKWVNAEGQACWVKYHFRTETGIANLTAQAARAVFSRDPAHAARDLFEHIAAGGTAAWRAYVQIMPLAEAESYRYDPFDVTKVWRYRDYPLIPIGRLVVDRNPQDFFTEIEQAALNPANLVPGIEPSPDRLLLSRSFTHETERRSLARKLAALSGKRADDFEQPGVLYRLLHEAERVRLVENIAAHLGAARRETQRRQLRHFERADAEYGARVARALGLARAAA